MRDELVRRARQGDHDAFCDLCGAMVPRLLGTACIILHDRQRAEDAVQEALVDAWRYLPGLREVERFDGWIHRLLVRACHRTVRSHRRQDAAETPWVGDTAWAERDDLALIAQRDELDRALRRLPPDQRAVLALLYYADLSLADCAAALGIPLGTVKSRAHRALDALRGSIDADERLALTTIGGVR